MTLWGPLGNVNLCMAVDTGASDTLVVPHVLDGLGYNPRDGLRTTSVITVLGVQSGYEIRVDRLVALGHEVTNFVVNAQDLHEGAGVHGLIGLNFLRHFNYEIRSREGLIRVEEV